MLYFDEATHTYRLNNKMLKSVSSIVASQFKGFNPKAAAMGVAKSAGGNPESPYFGMNADAIMKQWADTGKEARDQGTALHAQIEDYYRYGKQPFSETREWKQFQQFVQDHPDWMCIGNEMRVHNQNVAGTIDAVFDTPNGVVLVDWKRTKAMDFSGYGMGKNHMKFAADCNYTKYSLQLSCYKALAPFEVAGCFIVQFHPNLEKYARYKAQDFGREAKILIGS